MYLITNGFDEFAVKYCFFFVRTNINNLAAHAMHFIRTFGTTYQIKKIN